jgi:hypothetical protein
MKLLTQQIIKALPPLYSTENTPLKEKLVICKFFTPDSNWTWFVFEGEPISESDYGTKDDFEFFGMVHGHEKEQGYFLLSQLKEIRGGFGLPVERDLSVFKQPYAELVPL